MQRALVQLLSLLAVVGVVYGATSSSSCLPGKASELRPWTTQEEAFNFARCHVACVETYVQDADRQVANVENGVWPSLTISKLSSNCQVFQKMMECRRGCVERATDPSLGKNRCRDRCFANCSKEAECPDGTSNCRKTYDDSICAIQCLRPICAAGCSLQIEELELTPSNLHPLPEPTLAPELIEASMELDRSPGIYRIDYDLTTQMDATNNLTAFIFQVQTATSSYFYFNSILEGELDLSYLTCETVNVSFAAVGEDGLSVYSPSTELCIYGATQYPSQPSNSSLNYTWTEDTREGFKGHAMVNLTWTEPEGSDFISHYHLVVVNDNPDCGLGDRGTYTFDGIPRHATTFILKASNGSSFPMINCNYHYTLQALPVPANTDLKAHGSIDLEIPATATLILDCKTELNKTTGKVSVYADWRVDGLEADIDAIGHYSLIADWVTQTHIPNNLEIIKRVNNISTSQDNQNEFVLPNLGPRISNNLRLQVTPHAKNLHDINDFLYRPVPHKQRCIVTTHPSPPDPIRTSDVTVNEFTIDSDVLSLNFTWSLPAATYGTVTKYQVRVLHTRVSSDGMTTSSNIITEKEFISDDQVGVITDELVGIDSSALCFYAQIRSQNQLLQTQWSNWSDSFTLVRYPELYPDCMVPSTGSIKDGASSGGGGLPLFGVICLIVGILVVIAVIFVIIAGIIIVKRHRMRMQMRQVFDVDKNGYPNPMYTGTGGRRGGSMNYRVPLNVPNAAPVIDQWEIPVNKVIIETKFGEGCFGEVHKGFVRGPIPNSPTMKGSICIAVAIKTLKTSATGSERTDFLNEIDTMKKISKGNNPHVITFIGCVTIQEPLCLITEFVKHGDLLSYLETIRKLIMQKNHYRRLLRAGKPQPYLEPRSPRLKVATGPIGGGASVSIAMQALGLEQADVIGGGPASCEGGASGGGVRVVVSGEAGENEEEVKVKPAPGTLYHDLGEFEPVNLLSFAYQIASGMEYLSSLDIIHRDLACRNILVGENKNLKISDFGMSRIVSTDDIYVKTSKGRLPWKWMAIESIVNREFTSASDVWSYGVTLWEIATLGGFPYPTISNNQLLDCLKRGYRLERPENCSYDIYKLMQDCWLENPNDRPTFTDLRSQFDALLTKDNPYIQFENINAHMPYYNSRLSRHESNSDDDERTLGISASDFEFSSTSSVTMNGATASGYDYLQKPTMTHDHPNEDTHSNPYVETPTSSSSKYKRLSTFEDESAPGVTTADVDSSLDQIQRSVETELHQLDSVRSQAEETS